jgi:hypothetical protein
MAMTCTPSIPSSEPEMLAATRFKREDRDAHTQFATLCIEGSSVSCIDVASWHRGIVQFQLGDVGEMANPPLLIGYCRVP